jgi:hypothetical protein
MSSPTQTVVVDVGRSREDIERLVAVVELAQTVMGGMHFLPTLMVEVDAVLVTYLGEALAYWLEEEQVIK